MQRRHVGHPGHPENFGGDVRCGKVWDSQSLREMAADSSGELASEHSAFAAQGKQEWLCHEDGGVTLRGSGQEAAPTRRKLRTRNQRLQGAEK